MSAARIEIHDRKLARLENELRQAWSNFVEESTWQESLEAIAREMHSRAVDAGSWDQQEKSAAVEVVEIAAEQVGQVLGE